MLHLNLVRGAPIDTACYAVETVLSRRSRKAEPGTAPNVGPASATENCNCTDGPPSVS
jgi:hypothetical protein